MFYQCCGMVRCEIFVKVVCVYKDYKLLQIKKTVKIKVCKYVWYKSLMCDNKKKKKKKKNLQSSKYGLNVIFKIRTKITLCKSVLQIHSNYKNLNMRKMYKIFV